MTDRDLQIAEYVTELALANGERVEMPYRRWLGHPRPGVDFPDTAPMTSDGAFTRILVEELAARLPAELALLAGIDIGGFGFATALAYRNGLGVVDVRKVGSIRTDVIGKLMTNYELGNGVVISKGTRLAGRAVAVLDDCLMSGGTALATVELLRRLGARCDTALFIFGLNELGGRERLEREGVRAEVLCPLSASATV